MLAVHFISRFPFRRHDWGVDLCGAGGAEESEGVSITPCGSGGDSYPPCSFWPAMGKYTGCACLGDAELRAEASVVGQVWDALFPAQDAILEAPQ